MSSELLNQIVLSECAELSDAEILLRELPQDKNANHVREIADKLANKTATVYNIIRDNQRCGFVILEIYGNEMIVLAMRSYENINVFACIGPMVEDMAKSAGLSFVVFHTIRPGLIFRALQNGYQISSVILRKHL